MNPIRKAISEIKYQIPIELLDAVFNPSGSAWKAGKVAGLDDQILSLVIKPRVMLDCSLLGGSETIISLTGLPRVQNDDGSFVVRIPKDRTDGRSIISATSVIYSSMASAVSAYGTLGYGNVSTAYSRVDASALTTNMSKLTTSYDNIPQVGSANVTLIGENAVLIRDQFTGSQDLSLRCIVAYDENMSALKPGSYFAFCDLCVMAVKSFIHNRMIVRMDVDQLLYGQPIGAFKSVVENYSDADQNYRDFLRERWRKIAILNDDIRTNRLVRLCLGPNP